MPELWCQHDREASHDCKIKLLKNLCYNYADKKKSKELKGNFQL